MVAPVHNFSLCVPVERKRPLTWAAQVRQILYIFGGQIRNSEAAMGGNGGAQRPVWHVNKPTKTGARSARARTRGQNPLVFKEKNKD